MHRHSTVALVLFLAAGCEHSGSLDAPATPTASTEPAEAAPPPGEPTVAEPTAAPGASANPNAVVPPELMRPTRDFVGGARWSPGWGGERPRMKLQGGDAVTIGGMRGASDQEAAELARVLEAFTTKLAGPAEADAAAAAKPAPAPKKPRGDGK